MKKIKKGSTLVELCIVLAMSVIVFAMVGSFAMLVHYRSVVYQAQLDTTRQLESARSKVSAFLNENDVYDEMDFHMLCLNDTAPGEKSLSFNGDFLKYSELIDGQITDVGFRFETDENSPNSLIYMDVEYEMPISQGQEEEKFITYVFMTRAAVLYDFDNPPLTP